MATVLICCVLHFCDEWLNVVEHLHMKCPGRWIESNASIVPGDEIRLLNRDASSHHWTWLWGRWEKRNLRGASSVSSLPKKGILPAASSSRAPCNSQCERANPNPSTAACRRAGRAGGVYTNELQCLQWAQYSCMEVVGVSGASFRTTICSDSTWPTLWWSTDGVF